MLVYIPVGAHGVGNRAVPPAYVSNTYFLEMGAVVAFLLVAWFGAVLGRE